MHDTHNHHTRHNAQGSDHDQSGMETLQKLQILLEHWIEHGDSHRENYREWAEKASGAGEEEIAREIHLAIEDNESLKKHLQRARSILAAKLVLKK